MKKTSCLMILLFGVMFCTAQTMEFNKNSFKKKLKLTDVHCLSLINYAHGISTGEYIYRNYKIQTKWDEFLIEAEDQNKVPYSWKIPYPLQAKDSTALKNTPPAFLEDKKVHYYSEIEIYTIDGVSYNIFKHINYNCYDARCGVKHNHISSPTGVTYFSADFGVLVQIDNQNMQYDLMWTIKEKKVPYALIIEILRKRKASEKIIQMYESKTHN
ncbi:MAG: hypothetical protein ACOYKE_00155 [Ferruginibacter sp.]